MSKLNHYLDKVVQSPNVIYWVFGVDLIFFLIYSEFVVNIFHYDLFTWTNLFELMTFVSLLMIIVFVSSIARIVKSIEDYIDKVVFICIRLVAIILTAFFIGMGRQSVLIYDIYNSSISSKIEDSCCKIETVYQRKNSFWASYHFKGEKHSLLVSSDLYNERMNLEIYRIHLRFRKANKYKAYLVISEEVVFAK